MLHAASPLDSYIKAINNRITITVTKEWKETAIRYSAVACMYGQPDMHTENFSPCLQFQLYCSKMEQGKYWTEWKQGQNGESVFRECVIFSLSLPLKLRSVYFSHWNLKNFTPQLDAERRPLTPHPILHLSHSSPCAAVTGMTRPCQRHSPCTSKANTGLTPQVQVTQTVGAEPNAQGWGGVEWAGVGSGGMGWGGKEATHHQSDTKLGDSHDLMMRAFCTLGPTVLSNSTASCRSWANSSGLSVYSGFKEATSLSTVARRGGTCNHHMDHNLFNPPLVHRHLQGGTCNCHIDV